MHTLFLVTLTCLISLSTAMADGPITLTALSGENIRIWFATKHTTNGNTAESIASGVHVVVDGAIPGTCVPSNEWTSEPSQIIYNCEYNNDGTWVNQKNCSVQVQGATYISDDIVTRWANHGGETNCYQQVAVSPTFDRWLVDPVSGQHNFNFRFPIPQLSY